MATKIRVLELFKGTGSITKHFQFNDEVEIISLDILKKYKQTIVCDILDFDYRKFEVYVGSFDIIWASPECKIFSHLQYTNIGRKWATKQDLINEQQKNSVFINKTIEIILCSCTGKPKHELGLGMLKQKPTLINDNTTLAQKYSIPQGSLTYLLEE